MIDRLVTAAAVAFLNRVLERESWARAKLAPFAGRSARLSAPPFVLDLTVTALGLLAAAEPNTEPAVSVTLDTASFPQALFDLDPKAATRNVQMQGDAEFAQALSQVLENLRPEPEEELARFIGDAAAVRVVHVLRATGAALRDGGARLLAAAADYAVAENPMIVARAELERFAGEVSELRDAVERLEKRLERLGR
jgi:ubiquinone biosynthesis protein UbiJ